MKVAIPPEHLGRTGGFTPPPSAPWMLSNSAVEVLRLPSRGEVLGGTSKMSSTTRVSTSRLMKKRPRPGDVNATSATNTTGMRPQATFFASQATSSSSTLLPESWRRTWTGAGGYTSPTLRRAEETIGPERDLSTPARRANYKADRKMQQYYSAQQLSMSRRSGKEGDAPTLNRTLSSVNVPSADFLRSHKEREEAFKENANEVDSMIANLASSIRLENVKNSKDKNQEKRNKEKEAAARRQAAEERAAREKEAAARDPHKKVNLKVENTRKFGMAFLEDLRVPMQQVDFVTDGGIEHVNMVDILQIRQKCKRCDTRSTPSVETLIDDQARHDRLCGLDFKTGKSLTGASVSAPVLTPPSRVMAATGQNALLSSGPRLQCPKVLSECKRAQVKSRQSQILLSSMLDKLNKMRGTASETTIYNLEQIAVQANRELDLERTLEVEERINIKRRTNTGRPSGVSFGIDDEVEVIEESLKPPPRMTVRGATRKSNANNASALATPTNRKSIKAEREIDPKLRARAKRLWDIARYAASAHFLWKLVRRKSRSQAIIYDFLHTLGEWARIKKSMNNLTNNIKILQRGARQFLYYKKKRCDIMSKDWQRIEDKHLESHMKAMAEKSIQDAKKAAVEAKAGPEGTVKHKLALQKKNNDATQNAIDKMMKEHLDWKMYRVPAKERRAVISRFYMLQLKKKVNESRNIVAVIRAVVQLHRDTLGFLNQFGADASQAQDLKSMAVQAQMIPHHSSEFWMLSEELACDLIAYAVKLVDGADDEPWRDHPSHREITGLENFMYRPNIKARGHNDFLSMMGEKRPDKPKERIRTPVTITNATNAVCQTQEKKASADIDELWDSFTPRLRDSQTRPLSRTADRPSSRPGLGEQDQAEWRLC